MSVVSELTSDPTQKLIDINPLIEMDLHLIISAFELANREGGLEEGLLVGGLGEIEKSKSNLAAQKTTAKMYGGSSEIDFESGYSTNTNAEYLNESASFISEASDGSSIQGGVSIQGTAGGGADLSSEIGVTIPDNPFSKCFPCDLRLTAMIDNLPLPDFSLGYGDYASMIINIYNDFIATMNGTNFYADLCSLIDMLRIICPQDLLLLVGMLGYMQATYFKLMFQFSIDWVAIIGALLLPIILLIYSLLDMVISIGLNPVLCLKDMMNFIVSLANGIASTLPVIGQIGEANAVIEQVTSVAAGLGTSFKLSGAVEFPVNSTFMDDKLRGVMGKMSAIEAFLVSLSDIEISIPELFKKLKIIKEILLEMIGKGTILQTTIITILMFVARIIGLIKAIIELIKDGSICTDPAIPLSPEDVQAVIDKINEINDPDSSINTLGRIIPNISATTELSYDANSDAIIVKDIVTNESHTVPTCLGKITKQDQDKVNDWIAELDAID